MPVREILAEAVVRDPSGENRVATDSVSQGRAEAESRVHGVGEITAGKTDAAVDSEISPPLESAAPRSLACAVPRVFAMGPARGFRERGRGQRSEHGKGDEAGPDSAVHSLLRGSS